MSAPLGSFTHRASAEDVVGLRAFCDPRVLPPALSPEAVVAWQSRLDAAWGEPASSASKTAAEEVLFAAAPPRDEIDALLTVNKDPLAYFTQLHGSPAAGKAALDAAVALRALAFEIVLEADALALASATDAAPYEEFLQRYPDAGVAPSVLLALARVDPDPAHKVALWQRIVANFPEHPVAPAARAHLGMR